MILSDIGMVAVVNARSRAYLHAMLDAGMAPGVVLLLAPPAPAGTSVHMSPGCRKEDSRDDFIALLRDNGIAFVEIDSGNINDASVIEVLSARLEHFFIYSGTGGVLLRRPLLSCGKKFLHIHPGRLPDFRGSTTVYYHLLSGSTCGASAIFLEEQIDCGPLIAAEEYPFPFGTICDLDYDFDPKIRATTLVKVLQYYAEHNDFPPLKKQPPGGETYFIMHPVLRHIARTKLEKQL